MLRQQSIPPVLLILVAIFVLLHGFGIVVPGGRRLLLELGAFDPAALRLSLANPTASIPGLLTLVTHAFLHGNLFHLLFNCLIFVAFGIPVVNRMGTERFLLFFLLTAVGGAVAQGYLLGFDPGPMVGVSAVVFGLAAARAELMADSRRLEDWPRFRYLLGQAGGWMLVNAVIYVMLLLLAMRAGDGWGLAAWKAHVGGYVVGAVLAPILLARRQTEI